MSKSSAKQKWKINSSLAEEIKEVMIQDGGKEDSHVKGKHELWRIRLFDATFTYYKTGTLFCTESDSEIVKKLKQKIDELAGDRYVPPSRDYLIGLDETGKGEVLGPTILTGILIPRKIYSEVEAIVGVADSKSKRTLAYWEEIYEKLVALKDKGVAFIIDKITPDHIDRYNINKIMDVVYQRLLSQLAFSPHISKARIAIDDFGVGDRLLNYLANLDNAGAEVVITQKADEKYLETKAASLIAKREREKMMETIRNSQDYKLKSCSIGSGNAADKETITWLKEWQATKKPWPWFVKKSFKTIREMEGKIDGLKKESLPLREDILCDEFKHEYEAGKLSINNLSIVCPTFGSIRKTSLITFKDSETIGRCAYCKNPIDDLNITLRYYCGSLLPDSNIILNGLLSKDLEHSKFFEGFTILVHPLVKVDCNNNKGKTELERLKNWDDKGIVKLLDLETEAGVRASIVLDKCEQFQETALKFNAIILTDDASMVCAARKNNLFSLCL